MAKTYKEWKQSQREWAIANAARPKKKARRKKLTPEQIKHLHDTHPVEVRAGQGPHAGQLYCVQCQKWIQWLCRSDYEFLLKELA